MWVVYLLVGVIVVTAFVRFVLYRKRHDYFGKHVVITGGSEGIGRSLAERFYKAGAKVTIMARTEAKLQKAKEEIQKIPAPEGASIDFACLDVTKSDSVGPSMQKATEKYGHIEVLCIAAGKAYPGYFIEQSEEVFSKCMELNFMGALRCVKAVVPMMLKSPVSSQQILFVGSACSILGFVGYTSYAPTKFAVRGLADSLRNELKGSGISIHMCYPPDTDTPGFKEENLTKPKETNECFPPEVFSSEAVSECIYDGLSRGEYHIPGPDFGQNLLIGNMVGLTPRSRWAPLEMLIQPLVTVVTLALCMKIDSVTAPYGKSLKASYSEKLKKN
mmetsp:Transcript_37238/g.46568  ORF Transcript_37238/g.46568 Transcript_37238/m.46568 type:complete len:331 (+) Transcript_37238:176-1168(+)|eukprot:CAMPEP_0204829810 /NCGR_PEP_ID=MMETSP1346-20131115/8167_1 /ASSEMBLY_ACC=CAM_ASM_000771 /TAXON_ID=215587 /ORGANISM="Aplanochytrium stocchinoi, Strain GSBS06" /LENGTH=330 /DNA_ID=CAMNT_0051959899 /DNA_START=90 /DNA_END=1082 /DNA_ORIENTATION=-